MSTIGIKKAISAAVFAGAVAVSGAASAAAVYDLSAGDLVNVQGGEGGANAWKPSELYLSGFTYSVNGVSESSSAGMFDLEVEHVGEGDWQRLLTFCLEPGTPFGYNNPFEVVDNISSDLSRMWGTYRSSVDTKIEAAAFQIAIWEILTDAGNGYDLTSGDFTISDARTAVIDQANAYLTGWGDSWARLLRLQDLGANRQGGKQDLIAEVPAPGTLALFGLGLAALGVVRRKNASA